VSQIYYSTLSRELGPVEVQTGWDRRLQRYFVTIWQIGTLHDVPLIEDDLDLPMRHYVDVQKLLAQFGIPVPREVRKMLLRHRWLNIGNVVIRYDATKGSAHE
jgi:hypothetical protein